MTRHPLILAAIVIVSSAIGIVLLTRPRPEAPGHWYEPEDGVEPIVADPYQWSLLGPATVTTTYIRGRQGGQVTFTRVGLERLQ